MMTLRLLLLAPLLMSGCALEDLHIAHDARTRLMGMSEVDLESCLGAPDQHSTFGSTDVLTYYVASTSSDTWSVPRIGGFGITNGAYCHATFQLKDGHVTQILYSGEKNATLAPDAYCAPILRTGIAHLRETPATSSGATSSGATSGAATSGEATGTEAAEGGSVEGVASRSGRAAGAP